MKRDVGTTRKAPVTMKVIAALMDEPNPIHWDDRAVEALGLGNRQVNQGPTLRQCIRRRAR